MKELRGGKIKIFSKTSSPSIAVSKSKGSPLSKSSKDKYKVKHGHRSSSVSSYAAAAAAGGVVVVVKSGGGNGGGTSGRSESSAKALYVDKNKEKKEKKKKKQNEENEENEENDPTEDIDDLFSALKHTKKTRKEAGKVAAKEAVRARQAEARSAPRIIGLANDFQSSFYSSNRSSAEKQSSQIPSGLFVAGQLEAPLERIDPESGYPVYKAHILGVGGGGGTELCPFDCNCCF